MNERDLPTGNHRTGPDAAIPEPAAGSAPSGPPESSWTSPETYRRPAEPGYPGGPRYAGYPADGTQGEHAVRDTRDSWDTQVLPASGPGRPEAPPTAARPGAGAGSFPRQGFSAADDAPGSSFHAAPMAAPTDERRRGGPGWGGVVAIALGASLLTSSVAWAVADAADGANASADQSAQAGTDEADPVVTSTTTEPDWAQVAAAVRPSVVAISTTTAQGGAEGSGVIYDDAGHVVTNNHVVEGAAADGIVVTMADGQMIDATVVGTDPATDLAVLELAQPPENGKAAVFGNSSKVVVGDPVAAVGNPLGLSSTVTTGIVSALDRPVDARDSNGAASDGVVTNAIQVDAAVNPGNSGGPLFDATGRVIGINSSIATLSATSGSVGLGFAIPSDLVQRVVPQLIETGTAEHAYLGVSMMPQESGEATVGDITRAGAVLRSVEPGTPAAEAGLAPGDVVTEIDGKSIQSSEALTGYVRGRSSGEEVDVTYVRGGEEHEVTVTLATRPDQSQ